MKKMSSKICKFNKKLVWKIVDKIFLECTYFLTLGKLEFTTEVGLTFGVTNLEQFQNIKVSEF